MRGSTAGLPDTFQGSGTTYYTLITVLDLLFSALVVCPCVVTYWRSCWVLLDFYVYPHDPIISAAISFVIGACGHLSFILFQKVFENNFHPDKNRILYYIMSRTYTMLFAFFSVNGWRGPWNMLVETGPDLEFKSLFVTTTIGLVALVALRALRNVASPPNLIANDSVKGYFEVLTMFRVDPTTDRVSLFILDCLFTVLIVAVLVVFVWCGVWTLMDLVLFPDNEVASCQGSLIIGYAITAIVFLLQPLVRNICSKLTGAWRLLFADTFVLISSIGSINVWRGIWMGLDLFYIPEDIEMSCWTSLIAASVILILTGCSNSILVRGVFIDAEEPGGKCVVLPCYYFRLIFQAEKIKKINKKMQSQLSKPERYVHTIETNHVCPITTISEVVDETSRKEIEKS